MKFLQEKDWIFDHLRVRFVRDVSLIWERHHLLQWLSELKRSEIEIFRETVGNLPLVSPSFGNNLPIASDSLSSITAFPVLEIGALGFVVDG